MEEEYSAMIRNQVWEVVPRPLNRKIVGSRWHYVRKLGPTGEVTRYKARFVAKGFSQIQGIDYEETFSPVFRYESLRIIFALIASSPRKWHTKQRDVKNAFLNGFLKEEVYVKQPEGFERKNPDHVLKLRKALYGLKQSPRQWHETLAEALASKGYLKTRFDPSVFINKHKTVIVMAFVDDIGTIFTDASEEKNYTNTYPITSHSQGVNRSPGW